MSDPENHATENTGYFFVDEAGDLTVLGRRGKSRLGEEGVSKCFMVGMAQIENPYQVRDALNALHHKLLADPYLAGIESMKPARMKTAVSFHAKDDCPEVRSAVFHLLKALPIKVQVVIRRKKALLEELRKNPSTGINENELYDRMVTSLFKRSLHKAKENRIYFSHRGKSNRSAALHQAIQHAQRNFAHSTGNRTVRPTHVTSANPRQSRCLQVIDYFMWALQRLYEKKEDRFFQFVAEKYALIIDYDDNSAGTGYGVWYSSTNPLTIQKMLPVED